MAEPMPGSITGGTTPPNGAQVELMYFEGAGVNPFVATEDDALSTFALDVDQASWTMARNYLARGTLPPADAIRVEEFVNAFDAGWPRHADTPFRIHTEGAASRFGDGYHLLRIGLVGQDVDASERRPANLVFVIDVSGSMRRESRLGTVKQALRILLNELREGDRVGIVVYGSRGEVRLPLTDIGQRERIVAAIEALQPTGSTNVAEGLDLAYAMAREGYDAGAVNRLILCSDGVANTGPSTEAGGILERVRRASDEGITLSTIGFGMGNYNDVLMEKLADRGDGNYHYVDRLDEAERVFRENLTGLLQTIAREVKVQVAFDPDQVQRWRLLGYENRDVADRDFRNDAVDAGEVGAGHQVTALYELKLKRSPGGTVPADDDLWPGSTAAAASTPVATVRLRHEAPAHDTRRAGQVTEIEQTVPLALFAGDYRSGTPWMRVQTVVAEFAELLRHSYWAREDSFAALVPLADALAAELPGDAQVQDLARMVRQAADIQAGQADD
jgi:Ca-activated chloride channel family protein